MRQTHVVYAAPSSVIDIKVAHPSVHRILHVHMRLPTHITSLWVTQLIPRLTPERCARTSHVSSDYGGDWTESQSNFRLPLQVSHRLTFQLYWGQTKLLVPLLHVLCYSGNHYPPDHQRIRFWRELQISSPIFGVGRTQCSGDIGRSHACQKLLDCSNGRQLA